MPPHAFATLGAALYLSVLPLAAQNPLPGRGAAGPPHEIRVRFADVARALHADAPGFGRGCAMVDLDGDGLLDLIAPSGGSPDVFLRQTPERSFVPANGQWGIPADSMHTWGVLAADFDDDGDVDVYLPDGGFNGPELDRIYRNDLATSGTFTDVSAQSGAPATLLLTTFGGTVLDYDRDGDLDIFLSINAWRGIPAPHCVLLRNDGGLFFSDVSLAAGIIHPGAFKHCTAGDYDNDGWMDVAVGNYNGANLLYHNRGDGTFEEVALAAGLADPDQSFGLVLEDFDNDGWLDAYIPKYQFDPVTRVSGLYLNNGDGTFRDVSAGSGITGEKDMGHNTADVDDDGYPDIFIGTGYPGAAEMDLLFLVQPDGQGGLRLENASTTSGIRSSGPTRGHGAAFGDLDGDGALDIYANNGGFSINPDTWAYNSLWHNFGTGHTWLEVEPTGIFSSRTPVGLHGKVVADTGQEVHRRLSVGKGFCNTDAPILHFGLGDAEGADSLELEWPSGITQLLLAPPVDLRLALVETGILLDGAPTIGGTVHLRACGPAGMAVDTFLGTHAIWQPFPDLGGVVQIGDPYRRLPGMLLDSAGMAGEDLLIPNDPALSGRTFYLQSWIHPPGSGPIGVLSNLLSLSIP